MPRVGPTQQRPKYYKDPVRYRALLQDLGFQRGLIWQSVTSAAGTTLEVRVFEFETPTQALTGREDLSICVGQTSSPFDVADVPGAKGWQCFADDGSPVQEVMFARGRRLYKLKLLWGSPPPSSESITQAARAEAAVAR